MNSFSKLRIKNLIESPHKHRYAFQLPKNELPGITHPGVHVNSTILLPLFIRVISNFKISPSHHYIIYDYGKSEIFLNHVMSDFASLSANPAKSIIEQQFYNLDPKSQFNSVFIHLKYNGAFHHANMLIFDNKTGIAEIYEPFGFTGSTHGRYNNTTFKNFVMKMQRILFRNPLKSIEFPVQTCPRFGFQHYNHLNEHRNKNLVEYDKEYKIQGYCAMWSYYLLYLRVAFPKKSSVTAQTELILKNRENIPFIIRNFYFKFLQFIRYLKTATKNEAELMLNRPKKEITDKILTAENIHLCKSTPKNGGFTMSEIKRVARSYDIYGTLKKDVLCDLIKLKMNEKEVVKTFHEFKPFGAHLPPAPMKYNKNISKCHLSEKQGGYSIGNLRQISESYYIPHKKRTDICRDLRSYTNNIKKHKIQSPVKPKSTLFTKNCNKSEAQGGPNLVALRKYAKSKGIKQTKRAEICRTLKRM
jgi:hypothetical protein